ncbi:MAG: NUDIX domain-containing protein [Ruminiclostridium sp.]|nr:NUDIX domain-containing protein [Ruminiclostridium sp.]
MPKFEFTTMVMIQDKSTGKVLAHDRLKSYKGIAFPGGHIKDGESVCDCAVREIKEETGLDICNLKSCGMVHWSNNQTFDRYFTFLYKTTDYFGELTDTVEGKNFWISIDELKAMPTERKVFIDDYLPMFMEDKYSEAFGSWYDNEPWKIIYK